MIGCKSCKLSDHTTTCSTCFVEWAACYNVGGDRFGPLCLSSRCKWCKKDLILIVQVATGTYSCCSVCEMVETRVPFMSGKLVGRAKCGRVELEVCRGQERVLPGIDNLPWILCP